MSMINIRKILCFLVIVMNELYFCYLKYMYIDKTSNVIAKNTLKQNLNNRNYHTKHKKNLQINFNSSSIHITLLLQLFLSFSYIY